MWRALQLHCHLRQAIFNLPTKGTMSFFFFPLPSYFLFFLAQSEPRGPLSPSFTWQVLVNVVQKCRQRPAASLVFTACSSYSHRKGSVDTCKSVCWAFSMIFFHRSSNWRCDEEACGWMNTNRDPKGNVSSWGQLMRIITFLRLYLYCFLFTKHIIRVCKCPDIVSLMRSNPSFSTPANYDCQWWNNTG